MIRVVFVCSGNICRSPMAAGWARHKFRQRDIDALVVSCGTLNIQGHRAATEGIQAMSEVDIDISDHYSQGVQPAILRAADYVVVMAPSHEQRLLSQIPGLSRKLVRLWECADPTSALTEIEDPVGRDLAAFRRCRDVLGSCVEAWIESLNLEETT